jgi:hypothetical protein
MGDSPDPRENLTAALVRDYDDEQLVLWIHALQDREEELEAKVERLTAIVIAANGMRQGIREAGVKRNPALYDWVMHYDALLATLEEA